MENVGLGGVGGLAATIAIAGKRASRTGINRRSLPFGSRRASPASEDYKLLYPENTSLGNISIVLFVEILPNIVTLYRGERFE